MAGLVVSLLGLLQFAIFLRAILSWVQLAPDNPIVAALDVVCEPLLAPIRQLVGVMGGLDVSPLIAIIALEFLKRLVLGAL